MKYLRQQKQLHVFYRIGKDYLANSILNVYRERSTTVFANYNRVLFLPQFVFTLCLHIAYNVQRFATILATPYHQPTCTSGSRDTIPFYSLSLSLCINKTSAVRVSVDKNTFLNRSFINSYAFYKILFCVLFEQYPGAPFGRVSSIGKSKNTRDTKTIKFPDLH